VNFTDYLDTGIFLDHRITRNLIKESSSKKRFLNLFSYTGTATVHAAAGGALSTVSVDASQTYLDWAKQNMELNGFSGMNHFYYKADCISWLKDSHDKYDLIFLDPPTFSNSKSRNKIFDIQKDHVFLIKLAMAHLTTEGTLIFSNNFRKFVMEPYVLNRYQVEEISSQTVPQDFSRNQKIHRCWKIRPKRVIRNTNKIQPKQKITIRKKKTD
jgi:23S rRNA (guanine2445-N2)-methyltransferase / 23S rRNA (guanine2069-N7)-methyltransferase